MRRVIARYLQTVSVFPCGPVQGQTGGLHLGELPGQGYVISAALRPDRQSERRERGSLRPRERRRLLPQGQPPLRQGDHCYFEGDSRCWRVMQRRDYPSHLEIELEVEG